MFVVLGLATIILMALEIIHALQPTFRSLPLGCTTMPAKNRLSISFSDTAMERLESIALHQQVSKAEIARIMLEQFMTKHPDYFRLKTKGFSKKEIAKRINNTTFIKNGS